MRRLLLLAATVSLTAACGGSPDVVVPPDLSDSSAGDGPDGTSDAPTESSPPDSQVEAGPDAPPDSPLDSKVDALPAESGPDSASDGSPEGGEDSQADAPADAPADTSEDVTPDAAQDTGGPDSFDAADSPDDMATDALDDSATEAGPPDSIRLLVAGKGTSPGGVFVWNLPHALTSAELPSTTLSHSSLAAGAQALAVRGNRLFVGLPAPSSPSSPILLAFNDAAAVTGAAVPEVQIPRSSLVGSTPLVERLLVQTSSDTLWTGSFSSGLQLFAGASTLSSSSVSQARFDHPWQQTPGFAYDGTSDRLFMGQISGAGLLAWNGAKSKTGAPAHDFVTPNNAFWTAAIDGARLYAGGQVNSASAVAIWADLPTFTLPKAPTCVLGTASGISGFIPDVAVQHGFLVVTLQANKVLIFAGASTLAGDTTPTTTITTNLSSPRKALLSKDHRLYVLDPTGVAIFDHATTAPVFVAKLTTPLTSTEDILLME